MNHKQIKEQNIIEDYLCHRLDADLVDAFEEHLLFCARCRRDLHKQEILIASIQKAADKEQQHHHNNGADKQKLRIHDDFSTDHDYRIHDVETTFQKAKDRYRLLRIAAVITVLIVSATMLGLFLNQMSFRGSTNSGIIQNTIVLFKNFYSWNKTYYLKSVNRLVTEELYTTYHLNEKPSFQGIELLDELIYDQHRNPKLPIKVRTPFPDENIVTDVTGFVPLTFNGLCKYPKLFQNDRLFLRLFTNHTQDYYDENILAESEIFFVAKGRNVHTFEVIQKLKLPQGLYYFTIEMRNADPLFIGRFFVDALN